MANNSDYKKVRTQIEKLLPAPYQSDTIDTFMENTVNRMLTKKETEYVDGYVGTPNASAIYSRQIPEDTIIAQAHQLQPIISATLGTEKRYMSWIDIINELEEQGVDMSKFAEWGKTDKFNWVPPIDIDKLIHFRDYFWVNANTSVTPEYITIKSVLNEVTIKQSMFQNIADRYGSTFPIVDLHKSVADQIFVISQLNATGDYVTVIGNVMSTVNVLDFITIKNTVNNNIQVQITGMSIVGGNTKLEVTPGALSGMELIGQAHYSIYDGIIIDDELELLFEPTFTFFIRDTDNIALKDIFANVVSTELSNEQTIIKFGTLFTDSRKVGNISLTEVIDNAGGIVLCENDTNSFFDAGIYAGSDRALNLWGNTYPPISAVQSPNNPSGSSPTGTLWYATNSDTLYARSGVSTWEVIYKNYSLMLSKIVDLPSFNFADPCGTEAPQAEKYWATGNFWVHRSDVDNFASARQANYPIIEYFRGLELSEYLEIVHDWKYRPNAVSAFVSVDRTPPLFELIPFEYTLDNANFDLVLDQSYGDVVSTIIPGTVIANNLGDEYTVSASTFRLDGTTWNTVVTITTAMNTAATEISPTITSTGHQWLGYDRHWVYGGVVTELPSITQARSVLNDIDPSQPVLNQPSSGAVLYTHQSSAFSQKNTVVDPANKTFMFANSTMQGKAILDQTDVRVYLNGARMYGGYTEIPDGSIRFVNGIEIDVDQAISATDEILVEVAASVLEDQGFGNIYVRTESNEAAYNQLPTADRLVLTSAVSYRKTEQVKSQKNQYPQFSIYNVNGTSASQASPIFEYQTSSEYNVAPELGQRVVVDAIIENYTFKQSLVGSSDELYAYAKRPETQYWVDKNSKTVYKNSNSAWHKKFKQGNNLIRAAYSNIQPINAYDGLVWFNPLDDTLKIYDTNTFVVISSVKISNINPSINTIWQKAADQYIPEKKDWKARTEAQYNSERNTFIAGKVETIAFEFPTLTNTEVQAKALDEWNQRQINKLSPTGAWVGDWTIPDYLYYNPTNQNRTEVTTRELVGHFESIINSQARIPGYVGDLRSQFHVFAQDELDLGVGGNIRQYNNNFSTFVSSVFVDNIIIPDLFEFAQNQYQIILDKARDIIVSNLVGTITEKPQSNDITPALVAQTASDRSEDSNLEFIYGDTTTFDTTTGVGVRNWVATLPAIGLLPPVLPFITVDKTIDLYELVHHDGHRVNYALDANTKKSVIDDIISFYTAPNNHGFVAATQPPLTFSQLVSSTNASNLTLAKGFYWINSATRKIYSLYIDFILDSTVVIPTTVPNTYWLDTATPAGELKYSDGVQWTVVTVASPGDLFDGTSIETSNISMWTELDINELQLKALADIETRLYNSVTVDAKNYTVTSNMEDFFLAYTKATGNTLPFVNTEYSLLDPFSWNYRSTVFGNSYEMVSVDLLTNSFILSPAVAVFGNGSSLYIKNSGGNDGLWTVTASVVDNLAQTTTITVAETITSIDTGLLFDGPVPSPSKNTGAESAVYWKSLYTQIYGTPYPHLEPWKLQGFIDTPIWWDGEYKNDDFTLYGTRRWKPTMWTNIRDGRVPSGQELPSGIISTGAMAEVAKYNYVSVNIGNVDIIADNGNVYKPDDLYPPYFDYLSYGLGNDNRSLFSNINFEVLAPSANYVFGHNSKVEYEWREASQFLYDYAVQSYKESPINFVSSTFGYETINVNDLVIDSHTGNVPSYKRTTFHGEITNNKVEKFNGINQWYINYNRYTSVDTNYSNFYTLWTAWKAPLAYQFNSFIDTRTLDVSSGQVAIEPNIDYSVYVKKTNGVKSFSINGLSTTLLELPPKIVSHDNSHLWKVQISNSSRRNNSISYYDVRNYPFYADVDTNTMKIFTYRIKLVESIRKTLDLAGNLTDVFPAGKLAKFSNSMEFTVFASTYNESTDTTTLFFNDVITSITTSELISADVISLPWETGDSVWFTTERRLPTPLFGDTAPIGAIEYFIIKLSDTEFRVSETRRSALENLPVVLTTSGQSVHHVGEIENTFVVGDGVNTKNYWRHYKLDRRVSKTINMPGIVNGIQQYVDIIDGYVAKLNDIGFNFSESLYGWQTQIEKFIDYSFSVRQQMRNRTIGNRFSVKPNKEKNSWSYSDDYRTSPIPVGYPVNLVSANGIGLPSPFVPKVAYYMIHNSDGTFGLANSLNRAAAGMAIKLLDNGAANNIELYSAVDNITRYPRIEVNTFKDKLSFEPPFGVVSDIIEGPFSDINVANSLRDQYGNPLLISDFVINRNDTKTDVFLTTVKRIDEGSVISTIDDLGTEGYHYISAATFYVDTYEHVVEFSDYTNNGNLLYDGFVGLNLKRLSMNFNRPDVKTLRPNIGGSSVLKVGKNLTTIDNIERMADDLRYSYSSVADNESNRYAPYARETLGYNINSTEDYLESIDINEKSQFLFWQGLIQVKGSTRSIDSFINSKKFVDARIDEFWAYQVSEFGSVEEREYPQMYVNIDDIVNNNAKFEFIETSSVAKPGLDNATYDTGGYDIVTSSIQTGTDDFIAVSINDSNRWYKQPDQAATLDNNGLTMYFESIATESIELKLSDYVGQANPVVVHNFKADSVVVVVDMPDVGIDTYTVGNGFAAGDNLVNLNNNYVPFVGQTTVFRNGIPMSLPADYADVSQQNSNLVTVSQIRFAVPLLATDVVQVSYGSITLDPSVHFEIINSNIIQFQNDELFTSASSITLYNLQSNFEAHNASKLIDVKSDTVVHTINLFDPARGMYNQQAFNDVDMISPIQPAFFNRTEKFKVEPVKPEGFVTKRAWSYGEIGKTWLDTSELYYIPYYDEKIFPVLDDRLEHWGRPADFGKTTVYEWIGSTVPPSEYDDLVEDEQGNTDIPEHLRKSGKAKLTTFYIEYGGAPDYTIGMRELKPTVLEYSVIADGTPTGTPTSHEFVLTSDFLNSDYFGTGEFAVYVNGIFRGTETLVPSNSNSTIVINNIRLQDYVQFVIDYDVDEATIEQAIKDLIIRQTYEYTEVISYTPLGEEILTYYFWVSGKLTRAEGNSVSAQYIENNWNYVNYPYLVLQQLELAGRVESTFRTNASVDVQFSINDSHLDDSVDYLQTGQFQDSYSNVNLNTPGSGTFSGGTQYQPDDVITMSNGAVVRVIASDGSSNGEVTEFEVMFSGTSQPSISDPPLTQGSIVPTASNGTGFEMTPYIDNIGGFVLKLGSDLKSFALPTDPALSDSSDTLIITVNGVLLTEKDDNAKTGDYVVIDNRTIEVGKKVFMNDTIEVSYESNKSTRIDNFPNRYTRAIVRNIRSFINEDSRYTIRFRKDFTNDENSELQNKQLHREWNMFRQYQGSKIDRALWNKVTESMIGYKLDDSTELVPSVARRLYDSQNRDTTRYGLDSGQTFVNGLQAIATVMSDLNDVENEFRGIDVASFLALNSFDAPTDIITSMDTIYTTFPVSDVNRIFFLFLNDALSNKTKYAKLLKTSMISVYGVKVLDTKELFDE